MKQVLRKGLKNIVVEEVPDPLLVPNHVIVRPSYSLISSGTETASIHSDSLIKEVSENPSHLSKIWNAMKSNGPVRTISEVRAKFEEYAVLGYSGAGVVAAVHPSVTDLEVGQRVSYGGEGTGHGEAILTGRNLIARVPANVSSEFASFTTLGSIALNSIRTAGVGLGDVAVVLGLGLVGQLVAQLAKAQGAVVVAVDLKTERVELAKKLGADVAVHGDDASSAVASLTNGNGADCVIIAAAAKSAAPCEVALSLCCDRGRIVVVGAVDLHFPWHEMYLKEIKLFMSRAYGPGSYDLSYEKRGQDYPISYVRWTENRNMEEFLRLLSDGRIQVGPLITHRFALEDAARAYETILDPASNSLAVVLKYPASEHEESPVEDASLRTKVSVVSTAPAKKKIGVGVIGAGNLARWAHLPNLKRLSDVQLQGICSANGARGKTYAQRFGASYCCSDYDDLLKDPDINLVVILTRNQYHASQALAALKAGKNVFVEKPMALTDEECVELERTVADTGLHLTVGFNRRYAPFYQEQKKHLMRRTGPAVVSCRINSPGISGSYWMADPSIGGAILGEACHFIDLMYWLLESEPVSVSAYSLPTGSTEPVGENNMVASFLFADGSIGNLTYCTVGSKTSGGERVEVFAPGTAVMNEDFKELFIKEGSLRKRSQFWVEKGYKAQMENFIDTLKAGKRPEVSVRDGRRATVGCLRMLDSARTRTSYEIVLD